LRLIGTPPCGKWRSELRMLADMDFDQERARSARGGRL
jgi:hypothetical protein